VLFAGLPPLALDVELFTREQQTIETKGRAGFQRRTRTVRLRDAIGVVAGGSPTQSLIGIALGAQSQLRQRCRDTRARRQRVQTTPLRRDTLDAERDAGSAAREGRERAQLGKSEHGCTRLGGSWRARLRRGRRCHVSGYAASAGSRQRLERHSNAEPRGALGSRAGLCALRV
jgi:hypothetical protein